MTNPTLAIVASEAEAAEVEAVLRALGEESRRLPPEELAVAVGEGSVKVLVLGTEFIESINPAAFQAALDRQPAWSDLPILVLASRGQVAKYRPFFDDLGQVRLIERPLDQPIFECALRAALRSRSRQTGARALLGKAAEAERQYRELSETLEQRVSDRTRQLEMAYNRLVQETEERHGAEERLRETAELYRYTVELSQQIAWTADADKKLISASPRFNRVTGVPAERDVHEGWMSALHPEDLPAVIAAWNAPIDNQNPSVAEFRMRVSDGSYRLFRARAAPRLDEAGRIVRWYGYTEDIHDQRQAELARREAEAKLRESEELYRSTLELRQQIVWTAAADGTHLGRSQRYNDLTGLPADLPPQSAIHPDDLPVMQESWARSIATGRVFACDFRLRMRDGSYRQFRARAAPRRDEQGSIVRWYGTSEDIEEQMRAEQARREAEERYRLALRATNDVIWDLNIVSNQLYWSESAASMFGVAVDAPAPLADWKERVHPEDRERVSASFDRAVFGRKTHWSESYRFLNAEGGYSEIYDRGFIIRNEEGAAVRAVGAMSDVSDRVHAEAQLQRMQAELIHVSRVSAMGTMASTLAHELNQPLTAVTSYVGGSRRLLQGNDDPTIRQVRDALEAAEAGALRAGRIVRGLRELVARGNVNVKPEELDKLIHDACVLAFVDEHLLGISHRVEIDPSLHRVDVDRIQIQQVLINLIRNSVQAMADQPVREILISARDAAKNMVELCVADTGVGLTAEVREALFSPFRSTKSDGMGIGLSISRTIVEAHGGKIWASDRGGGGAEFRFTIPKARAPARAAAAE
jgi:two-component system sensor kinase FixL